jgi:hypothetical protein
VTDLVSPEKGGEAYQHEQVFISGTEKVITKLLANLPLWLAKCR